MTNTTIHMGMKQFFLISVLLEKYSEVGLLDPMVVLDFSSGSMVKNPPVMQETGVPSLDREEKAWLPTPIFLPGKSHG